MEEDGGPEFRTKLARENTSFCIESLLSRGDTKEASSSSFPTGERVVVPPLFPLLPPPFPSSLLPLPPQPNMEQLFKQELLPTHSLELLARSGILYPHLPVFPGIPTSPRLPVLYYSVLCRVPALPAGQDQAAQNCLHLPAASATGEAFQVNPFFIQFSLQAALYRESKYLSRPKRYEVATSLCLSETQVQFFAVKCIIYI